MNHKEELKKLIEIVKESAKKTGIKLRSEDIARRLGYDRSYFSQLLSAKGNVNETHVFLFKQEFASELGDVGVPLPGDRLNEERALILALFDDYCEQEAFREKVEKSVIELRVKHKATLILKGLNAK